MKSSIPHSTIFFSWVCALVQTSVIHIQVNWPLCSWLSVGDAGVPPLILMLFSLLAPGPSWQRHRSSTCQPPHLLAKDSSLSWVYSPIIFKSSMMTFPITTKSLLREKRGGFHNHPSTPNTQPRLANHRKELLSFPCIFHISFLMIRDTGRLFPEASYVLFIRVHVQLLSRAQPFWPPRLLACQAPLSMELSRQEYWSGDFPGGPVGKTPCSQCRGPWFDPWLGKQTHMPQLRVHCHKWDLVQPNKWIHNNKYKKKLLEWVAIPFSRRSDPRI